MSNSISNYCSITNILSTEERITCKIDVELPNLGYLDPTSDSQDLKSGTKLECPLWLAQTLAIRRRPMATIDVPRYYKENSREILQADAWTVTLNKWNQHYYEVGMLLTHFNHNECEKIKDTLLMIFKSRIKHVIKWAQNPFLESAISLELPTLEKHLFLDGRKAKCNLIQWLTSGSGVIETSELVSNVIRKRKREQYETD